MELTTLASRRRCCARVADAGARSGSRCCFRDDDDSTGARPRHADRDAIESEGAKKEEEDKIDKKKRNTEQHSTLLDRPLEEEEEKNNSEKNSKLSLFPRLPRPRLGPPAPSFFKGPASSRASAPAPRPSPASPGSSRRSPCSLRPPRAFHFFLLRFSLRRFLLPRRRCCSRPKAPSRSPTETGPRPRRGKHIAARSSTRPGASATPRS